MSTLLDDYPQYSDWIQDGLNKGVSETILRPVLERAELSRPKPPTSLGSYATDFAKGVGRGVTVGFYDPQDIVHPMVAGLGELAGVVVPWNIGGKITAATKLGKLGGQVIGPMLEQGAIGGTIGGLWGGLDVPAGDRATGALGGALGGAAFGGIAGALSKARGKTPLGAPPVPGEPSATPSFTPEPSGIPEPSIRDLAAQHLENLMQGQALVRERRVIEKAGLNFPFMSKDMEKIKQSGVSKGFDVYRRDRGVELIGPGGERHMMDTLGEADGFLATQADFALQPIQRKTPLGIVPRGTGQPTEMATFDKAVSGQPLNGLDKANLREQRKRWKECP